MLASTTVLRCEKIEQSGTPHNDALGEDLAHGLLAVATGTGAMPFSQLWAQTLVTHFFATSLMSNEPFETDWWVQQAQEKYKQAPFPAGKVAGKAQHETEKQDVEASLATLRLTQVAEASAHARLLVFGDPCIMLGRVATQQVTSFAMDTPASFDQQPIRVPAKPTLFDRDFHCGQVKDIDLFPNDTLLLATPTVSKWIMSSGGGRYPIPWQAFLEVSRQTPESWAGFIADCRASKTMTDDDCTALILWLSTEKGATVGFTVAHSQAVCEQRRKEYEKAKNEQNSELLAIAIGDGVDLKSIGVELPQTTIDHARQVAYAMNRIRHAFREASQGPESEIGKKVGPVWAKYASLLANESCASKLRAALQMHRVPLAAEQAPSPSASPQPSVNPPIAAQRPPEQASPPASSQPSIEHTLSAQPTLVTETESTLVQKPAPVSNSAQPAASTPEEQAFLELDQAARGLDYRRIVEAWVPLLETHGPAQSYRKRVEYARKQLSSALERFREALKTDEHEQIVRSYDRVLNGYAEVRQDELERLGRAVRDFFSACNLAPGSGDVPSYLPLQFMDAYYRKDNDESIVAVYGDIQRLNAVGFFAFTPEEQQRIALAQRRAPARQAFREALASGNVEQIVQVYDTQLRDPTGLTQDEIARLELARRFVEAYEGGRGDADAIASAFEQIVRSPYQRLFQLTPEEKDGIERANRLSAVRQRFRLALQSGRPLLIVEAFVNELVHDRGIPKEDREKLALARRFMEAYKSDLDVEIVHAYNAILASPHGKAFAFSHEEMARIQRAQRPPIAPGPYDSTLVTVNGVPISKKQFQAVRAVRIQYVLFRYSQLTSRINLPQETRRWLSAQKYSAQLQAGMLTKEIEQYLSDQALLDIAQNLLIQNEIKFGGLLSETDLQERIKLLLQEFVGAPNFDYDSFTRRHQLSEAEVRAVLAMYVRRDALARYRDDMRIKPLDEWLAQQKLNIQP